MLRIGCMAIVWQAGCDERVSFLGSDVSIEKGVLYLVATPIGNLGDLSDRARQVLAGVDLIAAEDTRHSRPLLEQFGISTPLTALHEFNERERVGGLVHRLREGTSIALISDAGTPLISDPGFPLVRACRQQGVRVSPVPGPCALTCALSASGLPSDRFVFEGFPARTSSARQTQFEALKSESRTLIFYEASHRVVASLQDMARVFGNQRQVVLARELTKRFETFLQGTLGQVLEQVRQDPDQQRGEFVLLLAGASGNDDELEPQQRRILEVLLEELPVKQAAALAARITGVKKNRLYQIALQWRSRERH